MKKIFSTLAILTLIIAPLSSNVALAQLQTPDYEFPEITSWSNNRHATTQITVPSNCSLSQTELNNIKNLPRRNGPIIAFGDSLTAGVGATAGQDYVSELERLIHENIINEGISGNSTRDALARLDSDVLSKDPSAVIVWLGGNDILNRYYQRLNEQASDTFLERILDAIFRFFGKNPNTEEVITEAETFENIEEIVERIQATGAAVILVGMDGEPLDNNLGGRYEAVAENTASIFVPDVLEDLIGRPYYTSDLLHPNNAGYDVVARRIYAGVSCIFETTTPDDDEEDDDTNTPPPSRTGSTRVCVDSDGDGYKECSYVRSTGTGSNTGGGTGGGTGSSTTTPSSRTGSTRVCVDSDNDGYMECSYVRS